MKSKFYTWVKKYLSGFVGFIFRVKVYGRENEPLQDEGPYILVSNHISNIDPVFLCVALNNQQPHFMAKKELFKIPLLKNLITALGAFPVDRKGANISTIKNTIKMLDNGVSVGIFPQGHRQKGKNPRETEVKGGAAMIAVRSRASILPCCIKNKKMKWTPFCKTYVYIGKPIKFSELEYDEEKNGEYARISKYIFDKVCELGEQNGD